MSDPHSSPTEAMHPRLSRKSDATLRDLLNAMNHENARAASEVGRASGAISRATSLVAQALSNGGRLIYVGAGTSGRLGVLDASECPPTFGSAKGQVVGVIAGGQRALRESIEGAEDDRAAAGTDLKKLRLRPVDVVCGISASGRTPYVLAALELARRKGCTTIFVTCNPQAGKAVRSTVAVALSTGAEVIAGSTRLKAGTATKLVLNALSTGAFFLLGRVRQGEMIGVQPKSQKLKARAVRIVSRLTGLKTAAALALLKRTGFQVTRALEQHHGGRP
jgi:N-acetylmuramic acid 6-phosphate etherase